MKLRLSESDTVLFLSHLGFETQKISITNYEQRFFNIEMKRNSILIPEIHVNATKPKYRRYKMGITKSRNSHVRYIHRNALFIPNKLQLEGYTIESVHIYIHNMGNPYTPFYISIYEAEADSVAPNDSLKRIGQIRTIAKKSEGFHVVDISAHKIAFGSTGMFVEIEADLEAESAWELAIKGKSYFVETNKTIGIGEAWDEINKCYGWYFRSDSGWQREVIHRVNVPRNVEVALGNPMIYVTVSKIRTK
jgi:hypothetical protein